nr:choice-of-anchor Q domain-containing protein [uncultured Dyadobacter sp.]
MNTQLLRPLFTLFCALLIAMAAHSAVIYNNTFPNSNFNTPTSINSNLTSAWTGIGDTPYAYGYAGNNCMALSAHNHVYVLTVNIKEGFQVELTSITFNKFSSDNATFQIQVDGVNYGSSFSSSLDMAGVTRTKTVSKLRNRMVIRIAVTNSSTPNQNYSGIDNFVLNGTVSGYDAAAEAQPDANGILYVDGGTASPGDGSSWDQPLKRMYHATRGAALNAAIKQVWVVSGEYQTEATNTPFSLTDGVAYYGGFEGYESDLRDRLLTAQTVLAGQGGTVIATSGAGATTRLDGFTITAGTGFSVGNERRGGALHATNSSLVIVNCVFTGNATDPSATEGKGGAIYLLNSNPLILQCLFSVNSAKGSSGGRGGAIFIDNSSPTIRNCTFSANEVGGGGSADNGAALYAVSGSSPVIENSIIWNNTDPASPGGTSSISGGGTPVVSYSLIQGGFAGGTNILDTDPQFSDPSQNNFMQRKGSPVTNAGNPATDLSVFPKNAEDTPIGLDDNRRVTSQAIDLGPYEVTPASIWYVNATSSIPDPSGDSWANAFAGLRDALTVASDGDQVWVARGEYAIGTIQLAFVHGVKIYGSFVGTETALDQRPMPIAHGDAATSSVITSNIGPAINNTGNDLTRDDVFDGFTVTGVFGSNGGAMRNAGSSPTIANCAFLGNYANSGGAVYNEGGASPQFINTIFRGNSAMFGDGGAVTNKISCNTLFINCLIAGNSASNDGGAIENDGSIILVNCTIAGNQQGSGGVITGFEGPVIVRNSIIYGNGSGIGSRESTISVAYSIVEGIAASETDHNLAGTTNPQFAGAEDWTLLPCSPAVNRGTNEALPEIPSSATDLVNNARIYNTQTDMGAYELQALPAPGTLPASGDQATLPVYAGATAITSDCKTFGLIEPTGTPGSLGNVTIKAFLAPGNTVSEGQKVFVKRHYDITPSGTDGPAKVTLFFAKTDFEAYNQAYGNANNATLPANLKVVQYHGTSPYGFPGTYSGPTQLITDVTVTESEDHTMYLVSFQVSGFSGFFISGQSEAALPVTLVSFKAKKREHQADLQWQTSSEINASTFEIERSGDGKNWHYLGQVAAKGGETTHTDYSYTDALPLAGSNMYRLKMIDRAAGGMDGSFAYSRIAALEFDAEKVAVYPNPAVGVSKVNLKGVKPKNIDAIRLLDTSGKLLLRPALHQGSMEIGKLPSGIYAIEIQMTDGSSQNLKLSVIH